MDASTLRALIDSSSQELAQLHERLGCAPEKLEEAMAALTTCIHEAIHAQVRRVEAQVADVQAACADFHERIARLGRATGAVPAVITPTMPLLAQRDALAAEQARLESLYEAQREQCDALLGQARTLNACMSEAGGEPPATSADDGELRSVSAETLRQCEAYLHHVQQVYKTRKVQMEAQLSEILQLWSELHIAPQVAVHAGRASALAAHPVESAFHLAILHYTQQVPVLSSDGAFFGQFDVSTPAPAAPADLSALDTPTKAHGEPLPLPAHESEASAPELLQPSDAVLEQSAALRASLEQEKTARESSIQSYYDELCELWMRFDVPETEMDAFVLDHRGSTLQVVEAYRTELDKMRALKSQHMALFVLKTREQIWEQWDALFMSESERESMFPAYFVTLPGEDDHAPTFDWDELLAEHEQVYARLAEMLEQRAPILSLIGRYRAICDEARALEESAQDGSRLLGRGNRGDPGRLLREEKMRKRVKVQKPKLEQELLKVLPAWEAEHGLPFLMDGQRFIDYLQDQLGGAKENARGVRRAPTSAGVRAEGLAASRTANAVPATPATHGKRVPRAPTTARRGATPAAARPRVASQSRRTPYAGARDARTHRRDEAAAPVADDAPVASPRTPSSYLSSSLRSATPALPRW
ncbi:putative protein kinase YGL059W [Malassezia caprae]|uniref:Anaphase spindle elongation protein 1 n=1 Tax=Malassezia caprae TaxID=1381934 RepID=A0AAF0E6B3_9BASI|nr:putative protein kinase YGL059W [Malassezia caprae]